VIAVQKSHVFGSLILATASFVHPITIVLRMSFVINNQEEEVVNARENMKMILCVFMTLSMIEVF
jgi:hypothetical protein